MRKTLKIILLALPVLFIHAYAVSIMGMSPVESRGIIFLAPLDIMAEGYTREIANLYSVHVPGAFASWILVSLALLLMCVRTKGFWRGSCYLLLVVVVGLPHLYVLAYGMLRLLLYE